MMDPLLSSVLLFIIPFVTPSTFKNLRKVNKELRSISWDQYWYLLSSHVREINEGEILGSVISVYGERISLLKNVSMDLFYSHTVNGVTREFALTNKRGDTYNNLVVKKTWEKSNRVVTIRYERDYGIFVANFYEDTSVRYIENRKHASSKKCMCKEHVSERKLLHYKYKRVWLKSLYDSTAFDVLSRSI